MENSKTRIVGGADYNFDVVIDAKGATLEQMQDKYVKKYQPTHKADNIKVFSLNGKDWTNAEEIAEDIESIRADTLNVGIKVEVTHANFIDGKDIIERIADNAFDEFDDLTDEYISLLSEDKHAKEIENLVLEYLDKNVPQPTFYYVKNVKKITAKEFLKKY